MPEKIKPYNPDRHWLWLDTAGGARPHHFTVVVNSIPVAWFSNYRAAEHTANTEYLHELDVLITSPFEQVVIRGRKVA